MAKSIKLKDNTFWDSSSISHNKKTLDNYLNKTILSTKLSSNFYSSNNTYVEINNWVEDIKVGDKLSISNGKIKIGARVSKIKISGQFGLYASASDIYYFWTRKNGYDCGIWVVDTITAGYHVIPFNQTITVSEGDVISVAVYKSNDGILEASKTILIFEVIE